MASAYFKLLLVFALAVIGACSEDRHAQDEQQLDAWQIKHVGNEWPKLVGELVKPDGHDLEHPETVYARAVSGNNIWVQGNSRLFYSADAGRHWSRLRVPGDSPLIQMAENDGTLIAITQSALLLESNDFGTSWSDKNLVGQLKQLSPSIADDYESFNASQAIISADLNTVTVVANCGVYQSSDRGENWQAFNFEGLTPQPGKNSYCVEYVQLNSNAKPIFAKMRLVASIFSGMYAMRLVDEKWVSVCTYEFALAIAVDKITSCDDVQMGGANYSIQPSANLQNWNAANNENDLVFSLKSHPLPTLDFYLNDWGIIQGNTEEEFWYIDYKGVSYTKDNGENWSTLIGGVGKLSKVTQVMDDFWIAGSRDGLAMSKDGGHTWIEWYGMDWLRNIVKTPDSIFVKSNTLYRLPFLNLDNPDFWGISLGEYFDFGGDFFYTEQALWIIDDQKLKVSADNGRSWRNFETPYESDDWHCLIGCITPLRGGSVVEMVYENNSIKAQEISKIWADNKVATNDVWTSYDGQRWVVEAYKESYAEDENIFYWLSVDGAKNWKKLPILSQRVTSVVFHNDEMVTLVTNENIFTVTGESEITHRRLLSGSYADEACKLSDGRVIIPSIELDHPEINDPFRYAVLVFDTANKDWVAKASEYFYCARL